MSKKGLYDFSLSSEGQEELFESAWYDKPEKSTSLVEQQCLRIEFYSDNDTCFLTLSGTINAESITSFKKEAEHIIQSNDKTLIIDMKGLNAMNSDGLAVLLKLARHFNLHITAHHVSDNIYSLLDMSGLNQIIKINPPSCH